MVIIGWLLIIVGVLFIVLSFIGALRKILKKEILRVEKQKGLPNIEVIKVFTNLISALTKLIKTILTAPEWLLLFAVGALLIYFGTRLQAGLPLI